MSKLAKEGRYVTLRDSKGDLVQKVVGDNPNSRETWRQHLRRLTNNGFEQFEVMREISMGTPFIPILPDGRQGEPQVPAATARLQASQFLIEMMYGKAVAQTEMVKAEQETHLQEQFKALSDDELKAKVLAALEQRVIDPGQESDGVYEPHVKYADPPDNEDPGEE